MKGHEVVAHALRECGVDVLFGFMGDANMLHVTSFVSKAGGRFIHSVHEGGSCSMADGYGRTTGTVGVVSVTHGPGTTNTLTALTEAVKARSGLLMITGDVPSLRNQIQGIDLKSFADAAGAEYIRVDAPAFIADDVARALARIPKTRVPIVLDIPFDHQIADVEYVAPAYAAQLPQPPVPSQASISAIVDALERVERPIVLAGRGARDSEAGPALRDLAVALGAPVATTLLGRGLFRGDSHNLDLFGGLSKRLTMETIQSADAVIAFGAALNDFTSGVGKVPEGSLLAGKLVVQVDRDQQAFARHRPVDVEVIGDARETALALSAELLRGRFVPRAFRSADLARRIEDHDPLNEFVDESTASALDMRRVVVELDRLLPPDRRVVTDGGRNRTPVWRFMGIEDPRWFQHTSSFGSIGLGTGTVVGVAAAHPDATTVGIFGDGGGMMGIIEFTTAVREKIPLILVIMNDRAYGTEYGKLVGYGVDPVHSRMEWPSFVAMAKAFGGDGVLATTLDDLAAACATALRSDVPFLIEVPADPRTDAEA